MLGRILRYIEEHRIDVGYLCEVLLSRLTSLHCGGPADILMLPDSREAAASVISMAQALQVPLTIIGSGTNLLVPDSGLRGIVLHTNRLNSISIDMNSGSGTIIAECGVTIDRLCRTASEHGLRGLEPAFGLPGTVGGAIHGGAGCFGWEISRGLQWVETLSREGFPARFSANEADFSYRSSLFSRNSHIITAACFSFHETGNPESLAEEMETYRQKRKERGHYLFPSAGSVFKRPVDSEGNVQGNITPGELIELAGLKGMSIGGAKVADYHANFIINPESRAESSDVLNLIRLIARRVQVSASIQLEPEISILDEFGQIESIY